MYRQDMPDTEELVLAFAKRNLRGIAQVQATVSMSIREVAPGVRKLDVEKLGVGENARAKALSSSQGGSGRQFGGGSTTLGGIARG
jgi:hypothetical protein